MQINSTARHAALLIALSAGWAAAATCAPAAHPGGNWPMYGGNLANTRNQTAEKVIGVGNVGTLKKAWAFTPNYDGVNKGITESEPIVGDGCVYITTASGWLYAVNADSGELVWEKRIIGQSSGQCCAGVLFAPAVRDGVLYLGASRGQRTDVDKFSGLNSSFIIALDSQTGETIWKTPVATEPGGYTDSSVKFYSKFPRTYRDPVTGKITGQNGVVWLGISTPEEIVPKSDLLTGPQPVTGGFVILDARDGHQLVRTIPVPADEYAIRHDRGGSIWSTAAIDGDGYGYAGTGQPNPWQAPQSDYTDAIIRFDMARARDASGKEIDAGGAVTNPNFGKITGAFWGTLDNGLDLDFAGSPTLYKNSVTGEQMVAEVQKAGRIHAGITSAMVGKSVSSWQLPVTPMGSLATNFCSAANDGTNVYATGATVGLLWSINGTTGVPNWVKQVAATSSGDNPVQLANGVLFYADEADGLTAFNSATGDVAFQRAMSADVGTTCKNVGPGVAIARNTVYAMCGGRPGGAVSPKSATEAPSPSGWLIAYRLQ
jgi:outer membrane protein assembly factor BamB